MAATADEAIAAAVRALGLVQPEVSELEGGIANRSFRLRTRGRDLVLKLAGDARHALGGSIHAGCAMQELAARAGLAPPVVLADLSRGFVVSQHMAGRVPAATEFSDARMLGRVGAWIAALHALPLPPGLAAVDFGERAARCLARVVASGAGSFARQLAQELERRRAAMPAPARLTACHHDLHHRNFIDDGTRLLTVDWEYAGPGDPAADLASCIGYHALDDAAVDALLAGYGRPAAALRSRIAALGWIFDCLWYAWNATAGLAGLAPDPAEQSRLAERLAR
jgi:aminoglycoside phosphotransferase (APT) family kinase protein